MALLALALSFTPPAEARLEVRLFARVPAPGYPAAAVVAPDGTVYAGTFKSFAAPADTGPSKVFAFSPSGRRLRTFTVAGQTRGGADAVQATNFDRSGSLYLLDQDPPRVLKLDPRTGAQSTWATFTSLPACGSGQVANCSDGFPGNSPEPDFSAWGPDGSLYVTDYNQAVIWRVPPGGGAAKVWFTDSRLNGVIVGPAGIQLLPGGRTLMLDTGGGGANLATGKLYTLPILADGRPGELRQIWESGLLEAPDGFAVARSGHVYVALVGPTGNAVVELSAAGIELARVPADAGANSALAVPFDAPGSVAFAGNDLLVANAASIDDNSANWAILEIAAGEPGLAPSLPPAPALAPTTRYRLAASPRRVRAGRRVALQFTATALSGHAGVPVTDGVVAIAGARARTGSTGRARVRLRFPRPGIYRAWLTVGGRRRASATVHVDR